MGTGITLKILKSGDKKTCQSKYDGEKSQDAEKTVVSSSDVSAAVGLRSLSSLTRVSSETVARGAHVQCVCHVHNHWRLMHRGLTVF